MATNFTHAQMESDNGPRTSDPNYPSWLFDGSTPNYAQLNDYYQQQVSGGNEGGIQRTLGLGSIGWNPADGTYVKKSADQSGITDQYGPLAFKQDVVNPDNSVTSRISYNEPESFGDRFGWLAPFAPFMAAAAAGAMGTGAAGTGAGTAAGSSSFAIPSAADLAAFGADTGGMGITSGATGVGGIGTASSLADAGIAGYGGLADAVGTGTLGAEAADGLATPSGNVPFSDARFAAENGIDPSYVGPGTASSKGALSSIFDAVKSNPKLLETALALGAKVLGGNSHPSTGAAGPSAASANGSWTPNQQKWASDYFNTLPSHVANPYTGDITQYGMAGGEHNWFQKPEDTVSGMYQTYLNRAPDAQGLHDWTDAMSHGMTLDQLKSGFVNSPEYQSTHSGEIVNSPAGQFAPVDKPRGPVLSLDDIPDGVSANMARLVKTDNSSAGALPAIASILPSWMVNNANRRIDPAFAGVDKNDPSSIMMANGGQVKGALGQISDGQSDDVPIMGSRDEFMVPADVVSALGSGSSNAGAEILHRMMHEVRSHARSGPNNDIPPKAKSPLEYLRDAMKGNR